jgi:hypothetical protein
MDRNTTETGVGSHWEDRDITDKSISSKNNEKHNANKDVIIKLIVPEIRMHLPSYLIGSIALVTSSLSNSGRLFFILIFELCFRIAIYFQGLIHVKCSFHLFSPAKGLGKRIRYIFF